jgi:hypothetical protein
VVSSQLRTPRRPDTRPELRAEPRPEPKPEIKAEAPPPSRPPEVRLPVAPQLTAEPPIVEPTPAESAASLSPPDAAPAESPANAAAAPAENPPPPPAAHPDALMHIFTQAVQQPGAPPDDRDKFKFS